MAVELPVIGYNLAVILRLRKRGTFTRNNQSMPPLAVEAGATSKDPGVHILLYENIFLE